MLFVWIIVVNVNLVTLVMDINVQQAIRVMDNLICGMVRCGVVWCGMVWYGMVRYGTVR